VKHLEALTTHYVLFRSRLIDAVEAIGHLLRTSFCGHRLRNRRAVFARIGGAIVDVRAEVAHHRLAAAHLIRKIAEHAPNVPNSIMARQVLTPLDLERTYGLTEGNIFHGDLSLDQLFFMRPVPGWSQYRTPIEGLYLCGAGTHPGGGVTGAPGHNAAQQVLRDRKRGRIKAGAA